MIHFVCVTFGTHELSIMTDIFSLLVSLNFNSKKYLTIVRNKELSWKTCITPSNKVSVTVICKFANDVFKNDQMLSNYIQNKTQIKNNYIGISL